MRSESERDERVMTLVLAALDQPSETRDQYLRSACSDDPDLYSEVEERVLWEKRMDGFLSQTAISAFEFLDRPFDPGDLVAGRFRILQEVGRGGMGVVYDAYDEKLDRRVAIKSALSGYDQRLPPETRAAREVSHFNVCKVHDLHSTQTELGEVEFLTMEFIEGETLSARVRRSGPLQAAEALEIARQVCAGLAQAHRQGVIHGDLKCGNIILTEGPGGGTRAVITDFGLASLQVADAAGGKMSARGGSFEYMAPELFSGAHASVASDLYALGVVFHVMLTGRTLNTKKEPGLPPDATTLTMAQTSHRPPVERQRQPLPAPWSRIVARCLKMEPEDRYASVEEVIERLEDRHTRRKWIVAASAVAAAVALATSLWFGREPSGPPVRLAVLPIAVEGAPVPAAAGLSVELADRLSGARRGFVVIPPGDAQRNRVDTPDKAKTVLSATHVLRTKLRNTGGQIVVQASVIETGSGQALQELKGTYALNDVFLVAKALTATVTSAFRLRSRVPLEVLAAAAYPSYVQGLNLLRRDQVSADEAVLFFQKAIQQDPSSALPYAGLAEAQLQKSQRGYGREWLDRAAQSVAKAQSLNTEAVPVILAAGLLKEQHGWYQEAAQDYIRGGELAINNAETWKRLANVYSEMNRPDDAIATYQKAIRAQPDYFAPYYALGRFYYLRDQFTEAERLLRRVTEMAPGLAAGQIGLGLALKQQMRFVEAEQSLLSALRLQETAPVLTDLGGLYYEQQRYGDAARYFEMSLKAQPPTAIRYADLGDAYRQLGHDATAAYQKARGLAIAEVGQNPAEPSARANLAYVSARLGERSEAEFEITQAVAMAPANTGVLRLAALTFETLEERDKTLKILSQATPQLLENLNRQAELTSLQQDARFQEILGAKVNH